MKPALLAPALLVLVVLAGCVAQPPAPRPVVMKPAAPVVKKLDWFQKQMALARAARQAHVPKTDLAGARQDYYRVALAACRRVGEPGLTQYKGRCNGIMKASVAAVPAAPQDISCDDEADSPDKVVACND